jgi:hypothetical protein
VIFALPMCAKFGVLSATTRPSSNVMIRSAISRMREGHVLITVVVPRDCPRDLSNATTV